LRAIWADFKKTTCHSLTPRLPVASIHTKPQPLPSSPHLRGLPPRLVPGTLRPPRLSANAGASAGISSRNTSVSVSLRLSRPFSLSLSLRLSSPAPSATPLPPASLSHPCHQSAKLCAASHNFSKVSALVHLLCNVHRSLHKYGSRVTV
jgi:hypothetical protein